MSLGTMNMEEVMEIESTMGKSTRRPTDLNAPKRPLSPYFLWAAKTRASVAKANPEWSVTEISKELGNMWKSVPKAEVSALQAKYEKAKGAYFVKMEKYKKTANYSKFCHELLAFKIHETKKPFGSDPNAPKRHLSAYMLYAASVRDQIVKENPDFASTEVVKEQSLWWKALSETKRKPWVEKAEAGQRKYRQLLEKYYKTSDYQTFVTERDAYKAKMIAKRNKLMGIKLKKKRARSKSKDSRKAKRAKRSGSRKQERRRSSSRKGSTSRSASRRRSSKRKSSRRKSRKGSKRRGVERRKARRRGRRAARRAKTPKAPKRSASRASEASSSSS